MRTELRSYLFRRWAAVTKNHLVYRANKLNIEEFGLQTPRYFLKTVRILDSSERGQTNFWGKRGQKVFERHKQPASKEQVSGGFNAIFQKCRPHFPSAADFSPVLDANDGQEPAPWTQPEPDDVLAGLEICTLPDFESEEGRKSVATYDRPSSEKKCQDDNDFDDYIDNKPEPQWEPPRSLEDGDPHEDEHDVF